MTGQNKLTHKKRILIHGACLKKNNWKARLQSLGGRLPHTVTDAPERSASALLQRPSVQSMGVSTWAGRVWAAPTTEPEGKGGRLCPSDPRPALGTVPSSSQDAAALEVPSRLSPRHPPQASLVPPTLSRTRSHTRAHADTHTHACTRPPPRPARPADPWSDSLHAAGARPSLPTSHQPRQRPSKAPHAKLSCPLAGLEDYWERKVRVFPIMS